MSISALTPIKQSNKLLAALPIMEWQRWQSNIETVDLKINDLLFDSGTNIDYVHFPISTIISLQYDYEDGTSAEFAEIGNEGLSGIFIFMGGHSTCSKAIVIGKGLSYRIPSAIMLDEFNNSGPFRRLILRYMQTMMTYSSQMAACNRKHSIDQQLARILLLNLDRVNGNDLIFTHDMISRCLGVRREGISEAAKRLERMGVIEYTRGNIAVLDRPRLQSICCECYGLMKSEYLRLMPSEQAT